MMMRTSPETRVRWSGIGPIDPVLEVLTMHDQVDVELPAEFHHAIYAHFHSSAQEARAERLDEEGGAELLQRVAEVGQLHAVAELIPLVSERNGRVLVCSPAPHILIDMRADREP